MTLTNPELIDPHEQGHNRPPESPGPIVPTPVVIYITPTSHVENCGLNHLVWN